jgi:ribosome maturation factor RimP
MGRMVHMSSKFHRKEPKKTPAALSGPTPPRIPDKEVAARVWPLAEPVCAAEGVELVHVVFRRESGGRILRLFIDKPGGVTLDDCAVISQQIGDVLDVNLEGLETYNLEVSSPGPERPLGRPADFERFTGSAAKIRTLRALDGQKNFTGILDGVADGAVRLRLQERTLSIPLVDISTARLVNTNGENQCL